MDVAAKSSDGGKKPAPKKRLPGIDKGTICMPEDFDVLSERELAELLGVAKERLVNRRPTLTSSQVRKKLGLQSAPALRILAATQGESASTTMPIESNPPRLRS